MELWQTIIAAISTGLFGVLGTWLTMKYRRETDKEVNRVSEFEVLTTRMNEHTDKVTALLDTYRAELEQCKTDCAKCHEEHQQTQHDLRKIRKRVRELEGQL